MLGLLICGVNAAAEDLRLPFEGTWFVLQGGDTLNVNAHMVSPAQAFGLDFARVGGPGDRALHVDEGRRAPDFYSWSQPVLAPATGRVVRAVDGLPDHVPGAKDADQPLGNHVVLDTEAGFVFLAHLQRGTVIVSADEMVSAGQVIAKVGNSGNSDFPHLHLHIQDTSAFASGRGHNPLFRDLEIRLNGRLLEGGSWPLIRGLFVRPVNPGEAR